ncbi:hypothetical protein FSP39_016725 [Pinctada imbricata]|uniref:Uncharacterized protein n=1 Tax=Pinctada imbricata TaxID=66713 RepID=A0AA88XPK3_PINIB|nr:hypothetical protein FSP39_016725 [Pinctada imbricata]
MTVSVLLDGEESTLEFHDFTEGQENLRRMEVDAYVVVYSVNNLETFRIAKDTIHTLRKDLKTKSAVIVVANKIDLVRKRHISSHEGRRLAEHNHCKYIETSVALNHQVDELLVGILRQIRLKLNPHKVETSDSKPKVKRSGPLGLLDRLFGRRSKESSSCDNLYDL